jgi:hypothetical protein
MPRQGQDILKYSYEKADGVKGPNQNHLHPDMKSYCKFSQKKIKVEENIFAAAQWGEINSEGAILCLFWAGS